MEFEINAKGEIVDNGGKTALDCSVTIEGDINGMIGGVCCLIIDIAEQANTTVEKIITEIYTHIKTDFEN